MSLSFCSQVQAAIHIDAFGGISLASPYAEFDQKSTAFSQQLEYHGVIGPTFGVQCSIDIYKNFFRFGVTGYWSRRYDIYHAKRASRGGYERSLVGETTSIPMMFYVEGEAHSVLFAFGLGPSFTWTRYLHTMPETSSNTNHLGYLFSLGYEFRLASWIGLILRAEALVNMPAVFSDELPPDLRKVNQELDRSAYNVFGHSYVFFNVHFTLGVRFHFAKDVQVPLEKIWPTWLMHKKPPTTRPASKKTE